MTLPVPINRTELYLAKIAGEDVTIPDMPINNTEVFLARLAGADIVLPTPINTLQVWLAILCGEQYSTPPVQGAELIGVQMVRTEFLAASAGLDGVTTPTPENRAEEYWAKIAEEMASQTITVKGTSLHLLHVVSGIDDLQYVYGDTEQTKYSGKNLLQLANYTAGNVVTTLNSDGTITTTSSTLQYNYANFMAYQKPISLPAGTYTFSRTGNTSYRASIDIWNSDKSQHQTVSINANSNSATFTSTFDVAYIAGAYTSLTVGSELNSTAGFQIESGSTPTSFEPYVGGTASPNPDYPQDVHIVTGNQTISISDGNTSTDYPLTLGSLELCKIGDYQDYIYKSGDDWYVHKEVGENIYVGDQSELWVKAGTNAKRTAYRTGLDNAKRYAGNVTPVFVSNRFLPVSANATWVAGVMSSESTLTAGNLVLCLNPSSFTTVDDLTTWLATNNVTFYYALATATDTQITDATLVSQLNALDSATLPTPEAFVTVSGNLPAPIQFTYQGKL